MREPGRAVARNSRRVIHALEAGSRHAEDAHSWVEPKWVLGRAQVRTAWVRSLEGEHHVHQVLEHARACDGTFLGDVADEHERRCWPAADASSAAHSRTCATEPARLDAIGTHGLIESMITSSACFAPGADRFDARLGDDEHLRIAGQLPRRTAGISHRRRRARRGRRCALRLRAGARVTADARLAAEEQHRAGVDAATQHAVELADAVCEARRLRFARLPIARVRHSAV